jgi:hypothetical protein
MQDFPISQLRVVQYNMRSDPSFRSEQLMHETQVETFLAALLKLHYSPGFNPHNHNKCSELWEVKLGKLRIETDSYWWCSPTLGVRTEAEVPGARLNTVEYQRLWAHPELLQQEQRAEDLEDEWERRNS